MLLPKIKHFCNKWYNGKLKVYENEPNSPIIRIHVYAERHWTANIAHTLVNFYSKHWQWIWGIIIAILAPKYF